MMILKNIALGTVLALSVSGCMVQARARPAAAVTVESDVNYEPAYYDDNIVYYSDSGAPYYYVNGSVRFIPRTDARFNVYVNHYNRHRVEYRRWHRVHGNHRYERRDQWLRARPRYRR